MNRHEKRPLVFDIHHFALDDGPGIRTTVFLKGCPLSCVWCHNPESMEGGREIAFHPQRCIDCGDCATVCPEDAISFAYAGRIIRNKCTACGKCAVICPTTALKAIGEYYTVRKLIDILLSDRIFYESSQGGVTFSGGEPTLYMDYVGEAMKSLKQHGIHTAIETCGMFNLTAFQNKLLPYVDLILYDLKLYDLHKHKQYTGKSNETILSNLKVLARGSSVAIIPRLPLVPNITATTDNVAQIMRFLKSAGIAGCQLLPYNPGGIAKRIALGKDIPPDIPRTMMGIEEEKRWEEIITDYW